MGVLVRESACLGRQVTPFTCSQDEKCLESLMQMADGHCPMAQSVIVNY